MDIGSIFIILAVLVMVALFISRPFFEQEETHHLVAQPTVQQHEQTHSALLAERDRIIVTLDDLDTEHSLGKVPEEDYAVQRMSLLKAGAEILRKLDEINLKGTGKEPVRIPSAKDDELEALIAARRTSMAKDIAFCPNCGNKLQTEDKFCSRCGEKIG